MQTGGGEGQICGRKLQAITTDEVINVGHMAASKHRYKAMVQNTGCARKLPWLGVDAS